MALYHPRLLAQRLDELIQEILLWSSRASQTQDDATSHQREIENLLEQAGHSAAILAAQLVSDQQEIARVDEALQSLADLCNEVMAQACQTVSDVEQARDEANTTLEHWETKLEEAEARRDEAAGRLQDAKSNLVQAEAQYASTSAAKRAT